MPTDAGACGVAVRKRLDGGWVFWWDSGVKMIESKWWLLAAVALVVWAAACRYEVTRVSERVIIREDRWTGKVEYSGPVGTPWQPVPER
jgi:hypothetical protein